MIAARRTGLVLALLLTVTWATAQEIQGPSTVEESDCYECHQRGGQGGGIPLVRVFSVQLADGLDLAPGGEVPFRLQVRNDWQALVHDIEAVLDLSHAPSFGYAARPAPILDQRVSGDLADGRDDLFQEERSDFVTFETPAGGTELRLALTPATRSGDQAPDLELRLWPPGTDTTGDPVVVVDAKGRGGKEVWGMKGEVPLGSWLVEVAQPGWWDQPTDMSRLDPQDFTVSWGLWFNTSESDPVRRISTVDELDGQDDDAPRNLTLSWPLALLQPLTGPETIHVRVDAVATYDHVGQAGGTDDWRFFAERTFTLAPPPPDAGGNTTGPILEDPDPEPELPDPLVDVEEPIRLDEWGEMVGYATAFLVVLATISGGAFGNWTRKVQDWFSRGARRRIIHHTLVGYGLILGAAAHLTLFILEDRYAWSVGWLLGGIGVLGMLLLGVTGAMQQPIAKRFGYEVWRWSHFVLTVVTILAVALHIALDGIHFAEFQEAVEWQDPLRPPLEDWLGAP